MTKLIGVLLAMVLVFGLSGQVRADDAQDAKTVVDKAIKALGGEEALSKVKAASWKSKDTLTFGGNSIDIISTTTVQGLDHYRQVSEGERDGNMIKLVTVLAGDKGSRLFMGNQTDLDKMGVANLKRTVYLAVTPVTLLPLKDKDFKLESIAEEKVDDKPAAGIKVTAPDGKDFKLYFDKESGLPVRLVATVAGFMGMEFTQETTFSDYKEIGEITKLSDDAPKEIAKIKAATKIVNKRDGMPFREQKITEFKILDKVEPKTFTEI